MHSTSRSFGCCQPNSSNTRTDDRRDGQPRAAVPSLSYLAGNPKPRREVQEKVFSIQSAVTSDSLPEPFRVGGLVMGDKEYFLERERQERVLANSPDPKVRAIHLKLAERYALLARKTEEDDDGDGAPVEA